MSSDNEALKAIRQVKARMLKWMRENPDQVRKNRDVVINRAKGKGVVV